MDQKNDPLRGDQTFYNARNKMWYTHMKFYGPPCGGLYRNRTWFITFKKGLFHNASGPAAIYPKVYVDKEIMINALHWYINGRRIREFDGLWYEDLTKAQLKKLEFYRLAAI